MEEGRKRPSTALTLAGMGSVANSMNALTDSVMMRRMYFVFCGVKLSDVSPSKVHHSGVHAAGERIGGSTSE